MSDHEPDIWVNGNELSPAQAMAVRVAISTFVDQLAEPSAEDALGPIAGAYRSRLNEVLNMIFVAKD